MMKRAYFYIFFLVPLIWHGLGSMAGACLFCQASFDPVDGSFNQPTAELIKAYERDGRDALPYIREQLRTSTDPSLTQRAAHYVVELNDTESVPIIEDLLSALTKRVAFGVFGLGTYEFNGRMALSHALVSFGAGTRMADKIWAKYGQMSFKRKTEVPFILNALEDPKLEERLLDILDREEDQQLMVGSLHVLRMVGCARALPGLRQKVDEWTKKTREGFSNPDPNGPTIYYLPLITEAEMAILAIEDRHKVSVLQLDRFEEYETVFANRSDKKTSPNCA